MTSLNGEFDEKLDYAIFADTKEEPESVYKHPVWLRCRGGPPILTDTAGKLGDDLINGKNSSGGRFASIPAFTSATPGQTGGMLRRQCTAEYKVNVVERVLRRQVVGHPWSEGRFTLSDDEMTRSDCVAYLKEQDIPHEVPRSACVFCPFKSNYEWRHPRDNDPAAWARAVEVDEALRRPGTIANRNLEQAMYLHRSCLPLAVVDLGQKDVSGGVTGGECEGMCGV